MFPLYSFQHLPIQGVLSIHSPQGGGNLWDMLCDNTINRELKVSLYLSAVWG